MSEESNEFQKPSSEKPRKITPIVAKPGGKEEGMTEFIMKAKIKRK